MQKPALPCPAPPPPQWGIWPPSAPQPHPEAHLPDCPAQVGWIILWLPRGAGVTPKPVQVALLSLGSLQRDLTPPVPQFPRLSPAGLECGIFWLWDHSLKPPQTHKLFLCFDYILTLCFYTAQEHSTC